MRKNLEMNCLWIYSKQIKVDELFHLSFKKVFKPTHHTSYGLPEGLPVEEVEVLYEVNDLEDQGLQQLFIAFNYVKIRVQAHEGIANCIL